MKYGLLGILLTFLASPAAADCQYDYVYGRVVVPESLARDVAELVDCLQEEIDILEAANVALLERVAILEEIASAIPSTYLQVDRESNGATAPFAVANFEHSAKPKGRAFEMAIDHNVLLDLCADVEGCLLTLGSSSNAAADSADGGRIGPCTFLYDAQSGGWELDKDCAGGWGVDGSGRLPGSENPDGIVILNIANDCALATSAIDVRAGEGGLARLSRDRDQGLFLVSGLTVEPGVIPEDDYFCRLTLRD
jgi:hypothetical protein